MSSLPVSHPSSPKIPTTISDLEQIITNALETLRSAPLSEAITTAFKYLVPVGYHVRVQLEEDGRKKRSTAAASNWDPETGEIVIYFERNVAPMLVDAPPTEPRSGVTSSGYQSGEQAEFANADLQNAGLREITDAQIQECCKALAEAQKAGKAFISFKWFRDSELVKQGYAWVSSLAFRQAVLTKAIEVGAVLTTQIPNPKAPQHPTTTIKLNPESKYAQAVVPRFQPIKLRGEGPSASEIVIRDRGRF